MITAELLRRAMPGSGDRADLFASHLELARQRFVGNDWHHVAMWLSQIGHESVNMRYVLEIASGEAYEGRLDLGNVNAGDGKRYKGRGLLQVTGRDNYARCGRALNLPLEEHPELLEQPAWAAMSAGWVWSSFGCAKLCDAPDPVLAVTKRINGGTNGLEDRRNRYSVAMTAMKLLQSEPKPVVGEPPAPVPPIERPLEQAAKAQEQTRKYQEATRTTAMLPKPILTGLLQTVSQAIPEVARLVFDDQKQPREEVATAVLSKIVEATRPTISSVWTEQQAVTAVATNPALAQQAKSAIIGDFDRLVGIVARYQEADDKSRDRAAERAKHERWDMLPFLADRGFKALSAAFMAQMVLIVIGYAINLTGQLNGAAVLSVPTEALMILLTMFVATGTKLVDRWGQLYDYRIGSSDGSKASGDALRAIVERGGK